MLAFRTTYLSPGSMACDLLSKTTGVPSVSVWARSIAANENIEPGPYSDGWVDIVVDHPYLHRGLIVDALGNYFKVDVRDIVIEGEKRKVS